MYPKSYPKAEPVIIQSRALRSNSILSPRKISNVIASVIPHGHQQSPTATSARKRSIDLFNNLSPSIVCAYKTVYKWAHDTKRISRSEIFSVPADVDGEELTMMLNVSLHGGSNSNDQVGYELVYVVKLRVIFVREMDRKDVAIPSIKVVGISV